MRMAVGWGWDGGCVEFGVEKGEGEGMEGCEGRDGGGGVAMMEGAADVVVCDLVRSSDGSEARMEDGEGEDNGGLEKREPISIARFTNTRWIL